MSEQSDDAPATRLRAGRWFLRIALGTLILAWLRVFLTGPLPSAPGASLFGPPYRLSGVVHVHTSLSDGRGSPAEVIAAARRARADFLVVTDHNRVDPAIFAGLAGKPGDPIVIAGSEVSTEAGHVLAVGIKAPGFRFSGTLREVLDDIRHLGGCAFVAHPTSPRGETRFTQENEPADWGVEVVNGDTAWREASPLSLLRAIWTYPVNPGLALRGTLKDFGPERALWDRVLLQRFAPIVGGTDAHGRIPITRSASVPLPSYEALFGLVRTVVQLEDPLPPGDAPARAAIAHALCAGSSVVTIPSLADGNGFSFVALTAQGVIAGPGATVRFSAGVRLRAGGPMPAGTRLVLVESGRQVASGEGSLEFEVKEPGIYRVEAYVAGHATPWVLSNPISVLTAEIELSRTYRARPVTEAYAEGTTVLDNFDGPTAFAAEHDQGSVMDEPIIDRGAGRGSGGAALLSFHLNHRPKPPVWCALVDRTKRDLSRNKGISFWLKADGEYRVWFQIRDLNPASADEGTEAWFASVRTSPAWTLYNLPFRSLRSINRTSDGSFDPSKIAHLVFVIDHGAMPFGSSGKVWIDDLRAY